MAKTDPVKDVTKELSDADVAKLRAQQEAKARDASAEHNYCPISGVKYVVLTGLTPVKFKIGIPEMVPGVNIGEERGVPPTDAKRHVAKGYAEYVLDKPVLAV